MQLLVTVPYIRVLNLIFNYFCTFINAYTTVQFYQISVSLRFTHVVLINMYFYLVQIYNLFSIYTNFCTYFFKLFLTWFKSFSLIFQR